MTEMDRASPWHAGEIAMQRSAGVVARMAEVGRRNIRDHLIDQHRAFYPQLEFVVLGTVDPAGDAWATLRAGPPGFLHAPDPSHLAVDMPREDDDPAEAGLGDGAGIGLLGIELATRRRNRLNGTIRCRSARGFTVEVEQAYGNCPQYIQARPATFVREPSAPASAAPAVSRRLDDRARAMVADADTFFVATYRNREDGHREVDVSHRGGRAGFVRVGTDGVLTVPDFAGNLFFNTLGNMTANPRAGLAFVDFATGDLLQMTGTAEVVTDSPEIAAFQGAERLWRFTPTQVVFRADALPLRFALADGGWSPNALATGTWREAAEHGEAAARAGRWRPLRIARVVEEAEGIRSFYLEPVEGEAIVPSKAGQHLPIRIVPEGSAAPVIRSYTLSSAPSDRYYRLSVKDEGLVSRHLHGLQVGAIIEARAPAGAFTIDAAERRPAVLLTAGIGVTPMLAMLRHVVHEGLGSGRMRPCWLFYAARSVAERAFDREIAELVDAAGGALRRVRVLSRPGGAVAGRDYEAAGHIDAALLAAKLPSADCDFYLCGPGAFMQDAYDALRGLNVADERVHAEAFGPASLRRAKNGAAAHAPKERPAAAPVRVVFARSGRTAQWMPGSGSILELAEAQGLQPEFSCRSGACGTCRTHLAQGAVAYTTEPTAEIALDQALICCAVPAQDKGDDGLILDL